MKLLLWVVGCCCCCCFVRIIFDMDVYVDGVWQKKKKKQAKRKYEWVVVLVVVLLYSTHEIAVFLSIYCYFCCWLCCCLVCQEQHTYIHTLTQSWLWCAIRYFNDFTKRIVNVVLFFLLPCCSNNYNNSHKYCYKRQQHQKSAVLCRWKQWVFF